MKFLEDNTNTPVNLELLKNSGWEALATLTVSEFSQLMHSLGNQQPQDSPNYNGCNAFLFCLKEGLMQKISTGNEHRWGCQVWL